MAGPSRLIHAQRLESTGSSLARGTIIGLWVATIGLAAGGCAGLPQKNDFGTTSTEAAPARPEAASTTGLDQSRMPDTGSEFHAKPTDRQQFQVHIDFGRAFETQGNLDAAVKEYQDALAVIQAKRRGPFRPSDEALAHRRMASALDRQGRFVQAEAHYNKALKLSPKDPKVWNDAGYSYYLQGRWADAERALKTAARLAPDDERVRINLGLTLAASGRHDEALPLLGQATGDAVAHANLGYLLAATGQNDLARQQYETAIAMRPDLEVARRALARIALSESGSNAKRPDRTSVADGKNSPGPRVDKGVSQTKATATNGRPARDERGIENDQPLKLRAD